MVSYSNHSGIFFLHNCCCGGGDIETDLVELPAEMVQGVLHLLWVVGEVLFVYVNGPALDISNVKEVIVGSIAFFLLGVFRCLPVRLGFCVRGRGEKHYREYINQREIPFHLSHSSLASYIRCSFAFSNSAIVPIRRLDIIHIF